MYAVTSKYLSAIRNSHNFYCYADIYFNGAKTKSNVAVVDGTVTVDRTRNIRRSASVTLGDTTLFPQYIDSPLSPYGAELRIYQGINYADGTTETVPLGVFSLEEVDREDAPTQGFAGLPQVVLNDRSQALVRASFLVPVDYSGWGVQSAVTALVQAAFSFPVVVNFDASLGDAVIPGGTTFDQDRLAAVQQLCASLGAEGYFDVLGQFQVVPVPALTQTSLTPVNLLSFNASSLETDGSAWSALNANSTYAGNSTDHAYDHNHSGKVSSVAAGSFGVICNEVPSITSLENYSSLVWLYSSSTITVDLQVNWLNGALVMVGTSTSANVTLVANAWTMVAIKAPAAAAGTQGQLQITGTATGAGQTLYFDEAEITPTATPVESVWTIDASTPAAIAAGASASGVLVTAKRGISRSGCYNGVAVYGSANGTNQQAFAQVFDTDPLSPTYWGGLSAGSKPGPFGHVVNRIQNSAITLNGQALTAAQAALNNSLGLARSLSFTILPNPALEAGDIIQAIYSDGVAELHLLDSFTIPLSVSGSFTGTTRTATYQSTAGT